MPNVAGHLLSLAIQAPESQSIPTALPSFLQSPPTANQDGMEDWVLSIRAAEAASVNLEIR
jgi:hypothetical protein